MNRHVYELAADRRREAVTRQDGRRWEWDDDRLLVELIKEWQEKGLEGEV